MCLVDNGPVAHFLLALRAGREFETAALEALGQVGATRPVAYFPWGRGVSKEGYDADTSLACYQTMLSHFQSEFASPECEGHDAQRFTSRWEQGTDVYGHESWYKVPTNERSSIRSIRSTRYNATRVDALDCPRTRAWTHSTALARTLAWTLELLYRSVKIASVSLWVGLP